MKLDQRMLVDVLIKTRALLFGDRALGITHDPARLRSEITHAQRCKFGCDEPGQVGDHLPHEGIGIAERAHFPKKAECAFELLSRRLSHADMLAHPDAYAKMRIAAIAFPGVAYVEQVR